LLVLATLAVYYPVAYHPFVNFDDDIYVTENQHVHNGLKWANVTWAFTTYDAGNWHPLTWLSHAMDYQVFALHPAGHHLTNLFLHVVNVVLLFWVIYRATGYAGRSFMVAALFAVHPINVESVAWVAERKNLLSMVFLLLALGSYRWYAIRPRVWRYAVVAMLFALGLMGKPQVITLPCLLLLWDYWPLRRMFARINAPTSITGRDAVPPKEFNWLVIEKLPLFAIAAADAYITMQAQRAGGAVLLVPRTIRLYNAIICYVRYVGKAFWPSKLALFYPHPGPTIKIPQVIAALFFLLAITALVALQWRRRYLTVGWLWFVGALVPMIGLIQVGVQAMADRYAYLPFIGLFIMASWAAAELSVWRHIPSAWVAGASIVVLLALMVTARIQLDLWNDNVTLWTYTIQVTPPNYAAESSLGSALQREGDLEGAIQHFREAVRINPNDSLSNVNIGAYWQVHGDFTQAIAQYKRVIAAKEDSIVVNPAVRARAFSNMGYAYRELGDLPHAGESFEAAVALNPQYVSAWIGLGLVDQKSGKLGSAIHAYSQAMKLQPSDVGYLLLARALEQNGDNEAALAAKQQAKAITQNLESAQGRADQLLAQ
jgi:tetratricopeptide (TPR) repeat protein